MTSPVRVLTHERTAALRDGALPAVSHLLGEESAGLLASAIGASGGKLSSVRVANVTWWPGSSISVIYDVEIGGGPLDGGHRMVAVAGDVPAGALTLELDGIRAGLWRFPDDPCLPGLRPGLDSAGAGSVAHMLGASAAEASTRLRAYRPGRRAVVAVDAGDRSLYFKITRPSKVSVLHERHKRLPASLPVPRSMGVDRRLGILVLETMSGRTLRSALESPHGAVPHPAVIVELASSLPAPDGDARLSSPIERIPRIAGLLEAIIPEETDRVRAFVARLGADEVADRVPSHGDFYESQLLVQGGALTGMLDVDTYGWGRPGDDPATMLGHLAVWSRLSRQPARVNRFAAGLLREWDSRVDPVDLRRRIAAVVFGLASGPFRVQRADWENETRGRIAQAERWLDSADRVHERGLIPGSG